LEREELEKILASLLQKAKSNKNSIDLGEVQEAVKEFSLNEEQMEQVLLLLENKGIEIIPILDEDALKTIEKDGDKAEPDALLPLEDDDDFVKEEEGEGLKVGGITENIDPSKMSATFRNALHEDGVYNILLLGVEAIGNNSTASGRTDSIMIATLNTKQKTLGLTSIMRDSYVTIPGFYNTRINAAFNHGGVPLMYETIAYNYGLRLDGSIIVSFKTFQKIIDDLGGVDIEITPGEAQYLNTTNYISKRSNRTLKPGMNHMNGNQALGYSRVRKVATLDGSNNDQGRTSRHRRVMAAIFKEVKKSNPITLVKLLDTVFSQVQTDIKKSNASSYLAEVMELSLDGVPLDTFRLPAEGTYQGAIINGAAVVTFDIPKNKDELANFVFGSHKKPATESAIDGKKKTKNK